MVSKRISACLAVVVAAVLAFGAVAAFASTAHASTLPWTVYQKGSKTCYNTTKMKSGTNWGNILVDGWEDANGVLPEVTVTSSNPTVAKGIVNIYGANGEDGTLSNRTFSSLFKVKAPGKTTLTTKVSYKGTTYTYTLKLTVKKWVNPIKTLKIGSKSFKAKYNKDERYFCGNKSGKLKVALKSGWKLVSIKYRKMSEKSGMSEKRIKSGKKVKLTSVADSVTITCKNKKTGNKEVLVLQNEIVYG